MSYQLQDKVALVTGASSGLGEAVAIMFASRGAKVTLCGRDEVRLRSVFDQVVKVNGRHRDRVLIVKGDVTHPNVRQEMVAKTVDRFRRLDILVANAGVTSVNNDLASTTEESYDKIMDINVKSVFFLIQQAVPHLETTKGSIIVMSSMVSKLVSPPALIYPMSKAAIDHLTRCLALDLGPKGIRVNTVNPSYIPTRIGREYPDEIVAKVTSAESSMHPLGERLGTVEEVAEMVTFLASDAASFVTGENFKVDGGRSLCGPLRPV